MAVPVLFRNCMNGISGNVVKPLTGAMNTAELTSGTPFTDDCKGPAGVPGVPGLYEPTSP
jgi:hypothetical protein